MTRPRRTGPQGQAREAERVYRQALEYEPNFLPARVRLVELAVSLGHRDRATRAYAEILRIKSQYEGQVFTVLERQYMDVELAPLAKALASEGRS